MRRSLIHYWRINLAVTTGAAIATAALTGALLVGDSVRGSLRDLTIERLGKIDYALASNHFFRQDLADSLAASANFKSHFDKAVAGILLTGSATHATTKTRASNLNLLGINEKFLTLFEPDSLHQWNKFLLQSTELGFPAIAINEALQQELRAKIGDHLLIFFQQQSEIHRETLLGSREVSDLVKTVRFIVTRIIPNRGMGRFSLRAQQNQPLNACISLANLQRSLAQRQTANTLLVSRKSAGTVDSLVQTLQTILRENIRLEDFGMSLKPSENFVAIESPEIILNPIIVNAVETVSAEFNAPLQPSLTYLANTMEIRGKLLPYSTIAAVATPTMPPFDELNLTNGSPAPILADNEIFLNEWAAQDIAAKVGDTVRVAYYTVGARENLVTQNHAFRVAGITALNGLGIEGSLTPEFPGIHDAEDMQSWNPPFPVDLNLIRPQDEAYWDRYRATPKAFIALKTGQRLWNSRFGNLTSIHVGIGAARDIEKLRTGLMEKIKPEQMGYIFQPIKTQGLQAAEGTTDFGMLFIGFSWFLIVSAALLMGMLFRLGVEQRTKEIGTLLAVGYPMRTVRRRMLHEGLMLAGIGCLIGLAGAVAYAWILLLGLRTWWIGAIGSSFLFLHVNVSSLVIGYIAAIVVTSFSIIWTLWQLRKAPATALLHGVTTWERIKPSRVSKMVALFAATLAVAMIILAFFSSDSPSPGWFFGGGAGLLIAGLAALSLWFRQLRHRTRQRFGFARIITMATRYSTRTPGRSLLCAALVSCACFVIVAVAANRRESEKKPLSKDSGTGGFTLAAESEIPLHYDLNARTGRDEFGFAGADAELLNATRIFPLRLLPGEDVSCLNLYQPQRPRILGAPADLIARGGFHFRHLVDEKFKENPWALLEKEIAPEVIPALGDYNSVQWILHLGLGKDFVIRDEFGREIKLRFVGLFERSIFQSEILISEANFLKHFPSASGYSYFLIETPATQTETIAARLEQNLREYGFDASSTQTQLANFLAVENTYLSVFQTLGGLGLLLGTLGLGIILIRHVIERRGELATLRAFGFRRSTLTAMLLAEHAFLILIGIVLGSVSALLAVAPHLLSGSSQVPWFSLSLTLLAVFFVGMLASALSAIMAMRIPLLPALKAE